MNEINGKILLRKKICITIILLLFTVSCIPITIGLKVNNERDNENEKCNITCFFSGSDLIVSFEKLEYDRVDIVDGEKYAIYDAEYIVKNLGSIYYGKPLITVSNPNNPIHLLDWWYEPYRFLIFKKMSIPVSTKIHIKTDENVEFDDERFFADQYISLDLVNVGRPYPDDPDSNIIKAKYWDEKQDYEPTLAHLLVSTPYKYKKEYIKINNENLFYLKILNVEELPSALKDQRLGWTSSLSSYLFKIQNCIKTILTDYDNAFSIEAWNYLYPLIQWNIDINNWFNNLLNDEYTSSQLLNTIENLSNLYSDNILQLNDYSLGYYSSIIPPIETLNNVINELLNWTNTTPWEESINVVGTIQGIQEDEELTVTCRDESYVLRDEDDGQIDDVINFNFNVTSLPTSSEKSNLEPHNCTIFIDGNKHKKVLVSESMISFCFSGGTIVKHLDMEDADEKSYKKESCKNNFLNSITKFLMIIFEKEFFGGELINE